MNSPSTNKPMALQSKPITLEFRGESFTVEGAFWVCEDTGDEYQDGEQLNDMMRELETVWRRSHKLNLCGE
jgi:hypothetical protein